MALIVSLAACSLVRVVASPPTDTPAAAASAPAPGLPSDGGDALPAQLPGEAVPAASLPIEPANLLYWSPATGDLALAGEQSVRVVDLAQGGVQPQTLDAAPVQPVAAAEPALLTGAQSAPRLAWADSANQVFALNPAAGAAIQVAQEGTTVTGLALSPLGDHLALADAAGGLAVISQLDQPGGQARQDFTPPNWLTNLAYSPDGLYIGATDAPNFLAYILDAQTGDVVRTLEWVDSPTPNLYGVFFAPDWSRVAWVAQTAVQVMNVADGSKGALLNHEDHVAALAWSPDGTRLATVSATSTGSGLAPAILIWDAASGAQLAVLSQGTAILSLAFSPDGSQIAAIDSRQNLQIWNVNR